MIMMRVEEDVELIGSDFPDEYDQDFFSCIVLILLRNTSVILH